MILQTNKLTKYYGHQRGIIDIDLSIDTGEIYGFIGPNGAGKSTTIRTLLGLIHPSSGSATIFGKDIRQYGPEINEAIGYLPSEVFYYDDMRVIDLLRYSGSFYKKDPKLIAMRINQLASLLDLDLKKKIEELSYGNKKKVGIIQGLIHKPKLIILDEPTGGLDPLIQQKFFDLLKDENKRGSTILFSSHVLSEVQKLCNRVSLIKDGKIIRTETMSSLIDNNYKRFKLETATVIGEQYFNGIQGLSDLAIDGNSISFLYRGHINDVIKKIAALNLNNMLVEEPDLEEIFLHYYQKDE